MLYGNYVNNIWRLGFHSRPRLSAHIAPDHLPYFEREAPIRGRDVKEEGVGLWREMVM